MNNEMRYGYDGVMSQAHFLLSKDELEVYDYEEL